MKNFTPQDPDFAARVRDSFARQGLMSHLGAELGQLSPGYCEIILPFGEELTQQHGFFHAGGAAAIADSAGGYAAYTLMPAGSSVLTVEYKINLLAPARGEQLSARGQVVRAGRTLTVTTVTVCALAGGEEAVCATLLQTLMCMHGKPDR